MQNNYTKESRNNSKNQNKSLIVSIICFLIVAGSFTVLISNRMPAIAADPGTASIVPVDERENLSVTYLNNEVGGQCGQNAFWSLNTRGILRIYGEGNFSVDYRNNSVSSTSSPVYTSSVSEINLTDWLPYRANIESVIIENGITGICYRAFYNCAYIKSVSIPDSIQRIEGDAFYGCSSLGEISLPDNISLIYDSSYGFPKKIYCHAGTTTSENLRISFISPDNDSFYIRESKDGNGNRYLSVTGYIGERKSVIIPREIEGITVKQISARRDEIMREYSFSPSIEEIQIPETVTEILDYTFSGCCSLESVHLPENLKSIGVRVFQNCSSLKAIIIPYGVTEIRGYTFSGCCSLESVQLPDNLKSIGERAFFECSSLEVIRIPAKTIELYSRIFDNYIRIECYKNSTAHVYAENNNHAYYLIDGTEEENSLSGTIGIKLRWRIDFATGILTIENEGSMVTFSADDAPWLEYKQFIRHVVIEDGCTTIGNNAFKGCNYIKDAILPEGLKRVGDYAFSLRDYSNGSNISLTDVNLPDSVESIGVYAFSGCNALSIATLPQSINSIGSYAFYNCRSLNLDIDAKGITINYYAFSGADVRSVKLESGYIGSDVFQNSSVKSVWLDNVGISSSAFYCCTSLETVYINTRYVNSSEFSGCSNLESVAFGENVEEINESAFYGCTSLKDVVLPYNISSINNKAFSGCKSLNTVTIFNRNCSIAETAISIYSTIYGYTDSSAERFANEYGYGFVPIDGTHDHVYDSPCDERCNLCNEARLTAHEYGEWYLGEESTCIIHGYNERVCSVCGDVDTERLPLSNHKYGEWVTEREPTCSLAGIKAIYCTVCNDCVTEEIPTTPHTYDNDCDEICNKCGAVRGVPHIDEDQDGYCDLCGAGVNFIKAGQTKIIYVNNSSISYLTFIPEDTGIYTFKSLNAADYTIGYICDADKNVINSINGYSNFSVTATLTEGKTYFLGSKYKYYSGGEMNVSLICDQISCKHYSTAEVAETLPTCNEIGYTAGIYCNDCEMWISGHEIIPVIAHTYDDACDPTCNVCGYLRVTEHQFGEYKVTKAPNCGNDGEYTSTCIICGATRTKAIPATASHTFGGWSLKTASTCKTAGIEMRKCTVCGCEQTRELPLAEHTYEKVIGTDATCTKDGKALYICTVCDDLSLISTDATGHNYSTTTVTKTCTENGYKLHTCLNCGDSYKTDEVTATGHKYVLISTKNPKCTENGEKVYSCSVCGEKNTESIPATGHKDGNSDGKCDSCGEQLVQAQPTLWERIIAFFRRILGIG